MKQFSLAKIAAKPFYLPPAAALFMSFLIEILARRSLTEAIGFMVEHPFRFFVNFAIIHLSYSLTLLTKRFLFSSVIVTAFWLTLGIANCVLMNFRGSPLTAVDFTIIGDAVAILPVYLTPLMIILIAAAFAAAGAAAVLVWRRAPRSSLTLPRGVFCVFLAASLSALTVTAGLADYEGSVDLPASDTAAYSAYYGFPFSFARTIFERGVDEPEDYGIEDVDAAFASIPESKAESSTEQPNFIFVQLESFFDITRVSALSFASDPIPNFRALAEKGVSGSLTVPTVGGGTANTEFELLTGIACSLFGPGEYPYSTVLTQEAAPSLAGGLAARGYSTHAIHNHTATFYDRNIVYSNLGFDSFTPVEYMRDVERNSLGWADDSILTGEILDALKSTDARDFVFAVSVQGHGKYPDEFEDEEMLEIEGFTDDETAAQYEYYVSQLVEMDAFVGELCAVVNELDEPTVLVFYGDHLPALTIEEDELSGGRFETGYVITANFAFEGADRDLAVYELAAHTMSLFDMDAGPIFRLHEARLNGALTEELRDDALSTLTYDLLYGSGFAKAYYEREAVAIAATPLRYGVKEITIIRVRDNRGDLTVEGENFTAASRIVIDGVIHDDTRYVDGRLILKHYTLTNGSRVSVAQVAEDSTVLSTTRSVEISAPASLPLRTSRSMEE